MTWFLLAIGTVVAIEFLIRLTILNRIQALNRTISKVFSTLKSSRISDHGKEKVLLRYAGHIFYCSAVLFPLLLLSFSPFLVVTAVGQAMNIPIVEFSTSIKGAAGCTAIAFAYIYLRSLLVRTKL